MQKEKKVSRLKVVKDSEIKIDSDIPIPIEQPIEKTSAEPEGKKIMLMNPPWRILNGSGKICLQMERRGDKKLDSGLYLAGNTIDIQQKYKSPIPEDAMFFIVDYDPDINYHYRKEKLKALGLQEENNKHKPWIAKLDEVGELDVLRKGDEAFLNIETWMPVKMKTELDVYYVVHFLDVLGINKTFPRTRLEAPQQTV